MLFKTLFICLALVLSFKIGHAQTAAEKAVAAAAERLRLAMISGDKVALQNISVKKLSYGHSGGRVENRESFIQSLASGKSDFVSINIEDQSVDVQGKTAVVRHTLSATTNDNNKPGQVNLKVMLVFSKVKGSWKLLARQAVKAA
ncbi:MAG: nuclear transport factor 2 family protein [Chitinophagaceae bacterium]|nr:MAG: nuclear transport factor 2 family protein [Chitinophagaceae bacterium]